MAEDYSKAIRHGTVLIDPDTGGPYKAVFTSTTVEGDFDPTGLATEAKQDAQITAANATNAALDGVLDVHVVDTERPLPNGAATSAKQDAEISRLNDIYNQLAAGLTVTDTRATTPVSVASLPLPTGAATAAKQDSIISALGATIDVAVTNTVPVSLADNGVQVENAIQITNTEFAVSPKQGATFPVSGTVAVSNPSFPVTGTVAVSSISTPVPVTDNGQSLTIDGNVGVSGGTITVDNTSLPLPAGASTAALQTTLNSAVGTGNSSLASIDGKIPTKGQKTQAESLPVVLAGDHTTIPVAVANFPSTQPVSVSNFPAAQPVTQSGAWTVSANPAPTFSSPGLSAYRNAALSVAPSSVKSSSGRVFGYHFANPNTTWTFIHFYNALLANVTVGTTVPIATFGVPANAVLDGFWNISTIFNLGIVVAATSTQTGSPATAPTTAVLIQLAFI